MATTLLSFLGRGPYAPDGKRKPYLKTQYQFDSWTSPEVTFFLHAALDWLRGRRGMTPDRLVVLGTSGSMWDELVLALCTAQSNEDRRRIDELCLHLLSRVDEQKTGHDDLDQVQKELAHVLKIDVHTELIPNGRTQEEQAQILKALQRHVRDGDRVILDVTHGFRHQPMLALGAAVLLARLRNAKIEEILYGANDMRAASGPAPVVFLRWLLDLLEWADSIGQLRAGGRLRSLTRVVQDGKLQKALADTAFLLATNQVHQAGVAAKKCQLALAQVDPDPVLDLTRDAIDAILAEVAGCQRDAQGILNVARTALREQDYVRTSILLVAALEKYEEREGVSLDPERVREIRNLRNSLAHASPRSDTAIKQALDSRREMEQTLQSQLDWLETQVNLKKEQP
ncbi:MAG TPA: TIGR02221 family CRISPR-associated protein [Gemmataceae bacterium]|nr:TIGR02221 family CRISPR-associated protein [Gemmataceae bacterium]